MEKISIITATYNRPDLLKRMIVSVLEQTMTKWELIIVDDSTNDDTETFIQKYKDNPRIIYLKNKQNEGLPFSRNRGLESATGVWVTFLDDDDFYKAESTLHTLCDYLKESVLPWCAFNKVFPDGNPVTNILIEKASYNWTTDFLFGHAIQGDHIPFFKKELIGALRYHGKQRSEWQFWYELSQKTNFNHWPVDAVVAEYLPDGMSNLGYLKKERVYQGQQFRKMVRRTATWKYLPIIAKRYVASFVPIRKLINRLRHKQTAH